MFEEGGAGLGLMCWLYKLVHYVRHSEFVKRKKNVSIVSYCSDVLDYSCYHEVGRHSERRACITKREQTLESSPQICIDKTGISLLSDWERIC